MTGYLIRKRLLFGLSREKSSNNIIEIEVRFPEVEG